MKSLKIGVLACQGAFAEHIAAVEKTGIQCGVQICVVEVRGGKDLTNDIDGLIIPGGESTTLDKFLGRDNLLQQIVEWNQNRRRILWGTCAGLIFLSENIQQEKKGGQLKLGGLAVTTCRNFFGRQRQSFEQSLSLRDDGLRDCLGDGGEETFHGVFIRAPAVVEAGDDVKVLATIEGKDSEDIIVAVQQDNLLATSFHPELTQDLRFHKYFIDMIQDQTRKTVMPKT